MKKLSGIAGYIRDFNTPPKKPDVSKLLKKEINAAKQPIKVPHIYTTRFLNANGIYPLTPEGKERLAQHIKDYNA